MGNWDGKNVKSKALVPSPLVCVLSKLDQGTQGAFQQRVPWPEFTLTVSALGSNHAARGAWDKAALRGSWDWPASGS